MAKIAVVGAGAAGMAAAITLVKAGVDVALFEAMPRLGGECHAATVALWDGRSIRVDAGISEMNPAMSPALAGLIADLDLRLEPVNADVAFATPDRTPLWFTRVGKPLFRHRPEDANKLLAEIGRFHETSVEVLSDATFASWTAAHYIGQRGFSDDFRKLYLEPRARSLLSVRDAALELLPIRALIATWQMQGIVGHASEPRMTITGGMHAYADAVERLLKSRGVAVHLSTRVAGMTRLGDSVRLRVTGPEGATRNHAFDHVIVAIGAEHVIGILEDAQEDEVRALAPVETQRLRQVVHFDNRVLPADRATWGAWNFTTQQGEAHPTSTVYVNRHQNLSPSVPDVFVSINPGIEPEPGKIVLDRWLEHPVIGATSLDNLTRLDLLQGRRRAWLAGGYLREPFSHEQAYQSGIDIAERVLTAIADAARRFEAGLPVSQGGFDTFLREVPMLAHLDPDALAELQLSARPLQAEAGRVLFKQGDAADGLYLVKRGAIDITRRVPGNRAVAIARRGSGSIVGEMSLLDDSRRSANAIAAEPTSGYFVSAEAFAALRADLRSPAVAVMNAFRREVAARARAAIEEVVARAAVEAVVLRPAVEG
ncbi:MAG TPA: FAD-dependent oxidoreductase, partial [Hyphomicrobiaceae bacterium]|nr:FAD-dependent oxidoreductase [Hyphomicrobiaceae bacterium]